MCVGVGAGGVRAEEREGGGSSGAELGIVRAALRPQLPRPPLSRTRRVAAAARPWPAAQGGPPPQVAHGGPSLPFGALPGQSGPQLGSLQQQPLFSQAPLQPPHGPGQAGGSFASHFGAPPPLMAAAAAAAGGGAPRGLPSFAAPLPLHANYGGGGGGYGEGAGQGQGPRGLPSYGQAGPPQLAGLHGLSSFNPPPLSGLSSFGAPPQMGGGDGGAPRGLAQFGAPPSLGGLGQFGGLGLPQMPLLSESELAAVLRNQVGEGCKRQGS
jgi:hypothetical protein